MTSEPNSPVGIGPVVARPPGLRAAYLLLAGVILFWGVNWPVMKFGLTYISPLWFGTARVLIGSLTLFAILLATGQLRLPPRRDLPVLLSVAFLQMTAFMALVNVGLLFVPAGRAAVLAYTTPLWVTPLAVLLLGERLTRTKILGLGLGLAGLGILFNPLGFDWSDRDVVIGNGLLLLTALAWTGAIVHIRMHAWRSTPLQLAPWQLLLATPVLLGLALVFEDAGDIHWSLDLVAVLGYNGLVATAFCFWASVSVSRALPAISTSLGFLGVPVTGVLASALALGEPLSPTLWGGLMLIVFGMALVNLAGARNRKPA